MARGRRLCALCVATLGCGSDVIDHAASQATEVSADVSVGGGSFVDVSPESTMTDPGNYPEPALTRCGGLGDGNVPIDGLRSAWGVVAVGGTEDDEGEVEPGTIRLRLGDEVLADCQDALEVGDWGVAITLTPSEAVTGVHDLASLLAPDPEHLHGGATSTLPMSGTLELLRVTQDCIVGTLDDVAIAEVPVPELSGAFAAELCSRTCLPTATRGC